MNNPHPTSRAPKTLLAILGSPHKSGSTAAMLLCATSAAKRAGWQVQTINLYEKNIAFCRGCRGCIETGRCPHQDDSQEIAALLKSCDAVVLAVKNMFDRLLGTAMGEKSARPQPRLSRSQRYLLLTACNTPAPFSWLFGQSRGPLRAMDEFFHYAGMSRMGRVAFSGAAGKTTLPDRISRKIESYWK